MGLFGFFKSLFSPEPQWEKDPDRGRDINQLADWLAIPVDQLVGTEIAYREFFIPKSRGGKRKIASPSASLKAIQKTILRRLLGSLSVHPCATAFEKGKSTAHNAIMHSGSAVILELDVRHFFGSTRQKRVVEFFYKLGWNRQAAMALTRLCTYNGSLPQGAPTSPRLANLINITMDTRLNLLARKYGAIYTRYADDIAFSFEKDKPVHQVMYVAEKILESCGYKLHHKKTRVLRQHQRQKVTGLVVNQTVNLPRDIRRKLRAVEHHHRTGRQATMTEKQLAGWKAYAAGVEKAKGL